MPLTPPNPVAAVAVVTLAVTFTAFFAVFFAVALADSFVFLWNCPSRPIFHVPVITSKIK